MTSRTEFPLGSPAPRAAVVALVAVVAAILTAVVHFRPQEPRAPAAGVVIRIPSEPPVVARTAPVLIDAIPWGRIERIETLGGDLRYRLPDPRETPVLFDLPAGEWRVTVSNPDFDEERTCELSLAPDVRDECLVEFERLSVDRYFREAGWWQ